MSSIYKCDRCGNVYDGNAIHRAYNVYPASLFNNAELDLCDNCYAKLHNWLEGADFNQEEEQCASLDAELLIFTTRLNKAVKNSGLSQHEIAEKCGTTDVSISRYLNGSRMPKAPMVANLADVLKVNANWLLGLDNPERS